MCQGESGLMCKTGQRKGMVGKHIPLFANCLPEEESCTHVRAPHLFDLLTLPSDMLIAITDKGSLSLTCAQPFAVTCISIYIYMYINICAIEQSATADALCITQALHLNDQTQDWC